MFLKEKLKNKDFGFSSQGFKNFLSNNKVENVSQIEEVKNKIKRTVDNRSEEEKRLIAEKISSTSMQRYGVKNTYELAKRFLYKDIQTPSGQIIKLQGYEDVGYRKLIETYSENDIVFKRTDVPPLFYTIDGVRKKYYPDFWIKSVNLIVEIKSKWTFNIKKEINIKKWNVL